MSGHPRAEHAREVLAHAVASSVDVLEAAVVLESQGVNDRVARDVFGVPDVVALARREIGAAGRRYREHGIDRVIFSKLDEADGPGCVLSALAAVPRAISCVTDGQRVPDDLHPTDGSNLLDLITGPPPSKETS